MKKFFIYVLVTILFSTAFAGFYLFFIYDRHANSSFFSPIPDFLTLAKNKQVTLIDLWLPFINKTDGTVLAADEIAFPLTAKSVLLFDLTTEKVLFEKNPRDRMPMASLTKIMTAIVTLENPKADDSYIVEGKDLVGEDSMGLTPGEVLNQEELLYGLMLPSGNDAAEVLASNSPFGRDGFVDAMNDKAKAMGLDDTRFSNPSGLQGDGIQHTTAYDLLVMTRYALENFPLFREIVATPEYYLSERSTHKAYDLISETNLLTSYEGVKGVKTGYTPEAGLCLVTYLDYKGHKIVGVILNSENRRGEMKELLDYSLRSLNIEPPEYQPE
jgi:serine-type D-Ala-D-Ala carboxypeptidase (penicillin-binding protein 5/6)